MTGSADRWWVRSKRNQLMNNSRWLVDLRVRRVRACAARPCLRTARRRRRLRSADFTRGDCVVLIVRPRRRRNNAIILYTSGSAERMDYISKTVTSPFLDAFDSVFIRHSKWPNSFQSVFTFRSTEITRLLRLRHSPIESGTLVSHQQSRYCRSMWVVISSLLTPSVSKLNYSPWIHLLIERMVSNQCGCDYKEVDEFFINFFSSKDHFQKYGDFICFYVY